MTLRSSARRVATMSEMILALSSGEAKAASRGGAGPGRVAHGAHSVPVG